MDVRRVVEIWNPGEGCAGTGYLVADRIVLTALHNVRGTGGLEVRRLGPEGREPWAAAELIWPERAADPQADAALLRVTESAWTPSSGADTVRWGRIDGALGESRLGCLAIGFPRSEVRGGVRDTKEIRGHIETLTGLKTGGALITAYVDAVAAPSRPAEKSRWSGASGAALFARGRLVGVVTTDRTRDYEANQLTAVSVASLAARPGFTNAAGGDLVLEDVTAASATVESPRTPYDTEVPRGLHNLPELPSRLFVGREEALASLGRALSEGSQTITQTLHGLGGVGKTTLALHYAHDHRHAYRLVWWIRADTPDLIDTGLAALAARLRGDAPALATAQAASWAIGWLQTHPGWLLVFDNAERPDDVCAVTGQLRASGRQLITSRCRAGWPGKPIPLPVLDADASLDLLARLTDDGDEAEDEGEGEGEDGDEGEVRALAEDLGHLPLALEQAGAFIAQTMMTAGEYRAMLGRFPAEATDAAPEGSDPARTMARIWRITLDVLHERDSRAVDLLRVAAWYAPTGIPRELFAPLTTDPVDLARLLALLANYNMITLGRTTFGVHRLVQTVARTASEEDPHRAGSLIKEARDRAAAWLGGMLPDDPWDNVAGWPVFRSLSPHAEALLEACGPAEDTGTTMRVLNQVAMYFEGQGEVPKAVGFLHRSLEAATGIWGAEHLNTLTARNNLAGVYRTTGDLGRAISLFEETLADCERVLGVDDPTTLRLRNNLADTYCEAGDVVRALPLCEQVVADRRRVLGADHPDTLSSRDNLAGIYRDAGDVDRAVSLYEQVLADRWRVLGADHLGTLTSRSNLASAYRHAGEADRAISLFEQVLADCARVLGEDHPSTLTSWNNLAGAYWAAGDLGRAIPLFEKGLAHRRRVLGADHPDTLTSRINLAVAYEAVGDAHRALPLYEEVLADCLRVLGADHPKTAIVRENLASARAREDAGRFRNPSG
ncbi:tetratricopeptide repeat protein [Streptomyces sp. NPDC093510]|uniref:tetratricopeptide repeat protein n=1 Tax=Streptomyces sp. NPDC093510 TaxID=3155199 RepID=UPI0034495B02